MCVTERETDEAKAGTQWSVGPSPSHTHPHTYTQSQDCRQGTAKYKGCTCLCVQNYQGKIECWSILSFIRVFRECSGPDGRKPGFCRASAGSNQTSLHLCRAALQAQIGALNTGMKVELFWPWGLSLVSSMLALRLGSCCGIMDIPFLCLFSLEIFTHTKETKWNASPLSQPTLFAPVPPYGLSLLGWLFYFFFHPQYPKEHMVIKTINAAFLRAFFLLVVNYDNEIHTHMHTGFSSQRCSQNSIILFYAGSNTFRQKASSNWSAQWDKYACM